MAASRRRRFGYIRRLPSGRYQASFTAPTGARQTAPNTFRTKTDADRWLSAVEADLSRGTWLDEDLGRQSFGNYARAWLRDHPTMGPRYRETCERNLRLHLAPLDGMPLRAITPAVVREWYASALRGSGGRTSIAQSYRFLRAVMNTAVRDGAIVKNPCQIVGAGSDRAKERPVASPVEVVALVDAITPRYRAAVLMAAWCGLRRGELIGLRREDVDLGRGTGHRTPEPRRVAGHGYRLRRRAENGRGQANGDYPATCPTGSRRAPGEVVRARPAICRSRWQADAW